MAHYFMQDGYSKTRKKMESSTEEEIAGYKRDLIVMIQYIVDGEMTSVNIEDAISKEDKSFDPWPQSISLRNKNGLSTKIVDNALYLGTNGDWINFSMIYDVLEIDWKAYFES